MSDSDRINRLEGEIERLEDQLKELRNQLANAELDRWRGRLDDLEVQARLGAMEADDKVSPLVEQARNRWLDAKAGLGDAVARAADVSSTLRDGLEQAYSDVRDAIVEARSGAKR